MLEGDISEEHAHGVSTQLPLNFQMATGDCHITTKGTCALITSTNPDNCYTSDNSKLTLAYSSNHLTSSVTSC